MDYSSNTGRTALYGWLFLAAILCSAQGQDTFYFNVKPESQDVVEGTETRLYCDVSDRRHIYFQWTQNGKPVINTTRKYQEDSNLRILRVLRGVDDGPFQCIATNSTTRFSLQSQEALLNILWIEKSASVILKRPKKEDIAVGTNITLKCQVSGNPEPTILWYTNKFRLFTKERFKITEASTRLKIINITAADNGVISCSAENMAGAVDSQQNFLLNVRAPGTPHLIEDKYTPMVLASKNEPARLDCPFEGASRIDWFSNYEKLSNGTRHVVYPDGSLYFPKVRTADGGSYRCEGLSLASPAQTFTAELVLSGLDDITPQTFEPRLRTNYPIVIPVEQRFELKVFPPGGQPPPEYRWIDRNDRVIGSTSRIFVQGTSLVFNPAKQKDSGNYTFVVNNTAAERKQSVWIMVSVPPFISRGPKPLRVDEDGEAFFNCQVSGTLPPVTNVFWMRDRIPLPQNSKMYHMDFKIKEATLTIQRVRPEDEGNYTCVANTTGQPVKMSKPAPLWVRKKLKFDPRPDDVYYLEVDRAAQISCRAVALSPPRITWVKFSGDETGWNGNLPDNMRQNLGTLFFKEVKREDEGTYVCVASHPNQGIINTTVVVKIVEKPSFSIRPANSTIAFEGKPMMLHCVALGDPKPQVMWYKDGRLVAKTKSNRFTSTNRYMVFANGTLLLRKVLKQDKGRYGCTANNSAGQIQTEFNLWITQATRENGGVTGRESDGDDDDDDMVKTIIIAVCSAGAYLALVIGLTAFCSYRLLAQRKTRKQALNSKNIKLGGGEFNHHREQHELLMKDRDSGLQCRSDSDNRSHVSGISSHPSHSSASASASAAVTTAASLIGGATTTGSRVGLGVNRFNFPRQDLQTLGIIGKGQFGDVFLAKARAIRTIEPETLVVVKSLLMKGDNVSAQFYQELDMYGKLEHPHIVRLLGICKEIEPCFMITEYCDWGDLKQFLLATRSDNGRRMLAPRIPTLTSVQKLKMCQQVALAMEYLSSYKFIHRDLACRNILMTSRMDLKVCSLSLCRDVYASEYYPIPSRQTVVPLRWLPPEAVRDNEYTFQTDIWSYGVFMWEVFHLAELPFRLHNDDDIFKALQSITTTTTNSSLPRLDFAENCPTQMVDIVTQCCVPQPSSRPSFSDLVVTFGHLLTNGDCV